MTAIADQIQSGAATRPNTRSVRTWFLHLVLLVTLALAVVAWGFTTITGASGYDFAKYVSLAGFFGVASTYFIVSRIGAGFQALFEIPVFMTVLAFVEFGAAPVAYFLDPDTMPFQLRGDTSPLHSALLVVCAGMAAFWLGATLVHRGNKPVAPAVHPYSRATETNPLPLILGVCLYLVSFATRVYLVRSGLYSFMGSASAYEAHLAEMQVWHVTGGYFGLASVILFSIETYYHRKDKLRTLLFWCVFASECFWTLLGGMKGELLANFLVVALVTTLARKKLEIRWFAFAVLGILVIYPLNSHYRDIVHGKANDSVTSVSAGVEALTEAASESSRREETAHGYLSAAWAISRGRVNLLQSVAMLIAYRDRAYMLDAGQKLWMIPIYPFVPRLLWAGKPVQDLGARFTAVMGGSGGGSALTIPGSLYAIYGGLPALLVGMFAIGLVAQWVTSTFMHSSSKRHLFIYACLFIPMSSWENDFFAYSTAAIRNLVLIQILAAIIYGAARETRDWRVSRKRNSKSKILQLKQAN